VGETAVLDIEDLSVRYRRRGGWTPAVANVSLRIAAGEALGLVGESGSGKSTVVFAALRYLPDTADVTVGRLAVEGQDLMALSPDALRRVRGNRVGAVYQHPGAALNPALTIGRQITEVLRRHRGLAGAEARERAEDLLAEVRVERPGRVLGLYPHELSGGMQQRALIAMATSTEPALLVLDEPTSALDASVQAEVLGILDRLRQRMRTSLLLISHDIETVCRATDRIGVMRGGVMVEQGESARIFRAPEHPYTHALVGCMPRAGLTKHMRRLATVNEPVPRTDAPPYRVAEVGPPLLACRAISQVLGGREVLRGIDFSIAPGETFGLIGESGSGKSTLAKIIAGLQVPVAGAVELAGRPLSPSLNRRARAERHAIQMVFQSPDLTLNPRRRIRQTLAGPLTRLLGLRGAALRARQAELLDAVRLPPNVADRRPAALSGGQRQRVAIARAFAGAPRLVILDEPTSALDLSVQATILNLLNDLQRASGAAYLFISHDLGVVRYMADRVGVLYRGQLVETGPADRVFTGPSHPYTRLLLEAGHERPARLPARSDDASDLCSFRDRCPLALSRCATKAPPLQYPVPGHVIRCWRTPDDLASAAQPPQGVVAQSAVVA
jgi:oligopeptide/dipeptide ABC transporter ATP-binding protein